MRRTMNGHRKTWTLAALSLLALPAAGVAQQTDIALVHALQLDQQLAITNATIERLAALGDRLNHEDVVLTSSGTRAAIRFADDGSLVRLNPSSRLTILAEGERASMVKTVALEIGGELFARVTGGQPGSFQVQTPAGVAAVKGTEFIVRVDENGLTTIITLEGVVEFFNNAGTADVTAGNLVVVASADDQPVPRRQQPDDIQGAQALLDDDAAAAPTERAEVEIELQDADGRVRTLILELPLSEARALLGGGG